ncbi:MAG: VOC family protein [Anaerolineales bacterium]
MTQRTIVHVEIPAADDARAAEFYSALFGWKTQRIEEMNYTLWDAGQPGSEGGFSPLNEENRPNEFLIYINSDDIEADLARAVSLGGQIIEHKTEISGMGWFGIFRDPSGNRMALYTGRKD